MANKIKSSKLLRTCLIVMAAVILLSAVAVANADNIRLAIQSLSADNAFYDENPTLEFAAIQGNAEASKNTNLYNHESTLEQGDGEYTITTNSFVEWFEQDDVAFGYKYYGVKTNKKDFIEITCDVYYPTVTENSTIDLLEGHHPSTGIELRSSLENTGSFFNMHIRDQGVLTLIYRDSAYSSSLYSCSAQENLLLLKETDYPISMKVTMSGTTFRAYYKLNGQTEWTTAGNAVALQDFTSGVYAGILAHSGSPELWTVNKYTNLVIQGEQSMNASSGGGTTETVPEVVDPDPEYTDSTMLLRETFTDGGLKNGSELATNPMWSNFVDRNGISIVNVENNRMLYSEYGSGADFIGNETWTDYVASMDFMYDADMVDEIDNNIVGLVVRSVQNQFYGYQNYTVAIAGGTELRIYKVFMTNTTTLNEGQIVATVPLEENILRDGKIHNIKVIAFDDTLTIYLDGEEMIVWEDNGDIPTGLGIVMKHINSVGSVGVVFDSVYAYVDNITVNALNDQIGGSYDNWVGGNWDVPVPWYIGKAEKDSYNN